MSESERLEHEEELFALEEAGVIEIYPVEVTEVYILVPENGEEMPWG